MYNINTFPFTHTHSHATATDTGTALLMLGDKWIEILYLTWSYVTVTVKGFSMVSLKDIQRIPTTIRKMKHAETCSGHKFHIDAARLHAPICSSVTNSAHLHP